MYMNQEDLIIEEYKIYTQTKEKFVDRNFATNKFYLILVMALFLVMFLTRDCHFVYGITSTFIFSFFGMMVCLLWWINVDSYNFLIKVKLAEVLEKIEEQLPVKPNKMEIEAINAIRKRKREFLFADVQKGLVTLVFLLYFVLFTYEIVMAVLGH